MKKNKFVIALILITMLFTGCSYSNKTKDYNNSRIAPDEQTEISIVNDETEITSETEYIEETNIDKLASLSELDNTDFEEYIKYESSDGNYYTYYFMNNMYVRTNEHNPLYDDRQVGTYEIIDNKIKVKYDTIKIRTKTDKNSLDNILCNNTEYNDNLHKRISNLTNYIGYEEKEYIVRKTSDIDYSNYNLHYSNIKPKVIELALSNIRDKSDKIKIITCNNEDILIQFLGKTINQVENKNYTKVAYKDLTKNKKDIYLTCYGCYNIDNETILSLNTDNTFVSTYNYYKTTNDNKNSNDKYDYIGEFETDNKTYITFKYNKIKRNKLTTEKREEILSKIAQNKEKYKYTKTYKLKLDLKEYDKKTTENNWICPDKRLTITRGNRKIQLISCTNI